jgi:hypothetical protein
MIPMHIEPSTQVTPEDIELALTLIDALDEASLILATRFPEVIAAPSLAQGFAAARRTGYTFLGLLYATYEAQRETEA